MRDAIAGLGEPEPEALAGRAQEVVVLGVLAVGLEQVVVDVLHRNLGARPVQAHRLELQHHHRAGGVLGEGLVDVQPDLLARGPLAGHQVGLDQLLRNVLCLSVVCHGVPPRPP